MADLGTLLFSAASRTVVVKGARRSLSHILTFDPAIAVLGLLVFGMLSCGKPGTDDTAKAPAKSDAEQSQAAAPVEEAVAPAVVEPVRGTERDLWRLGVDALGRKSNWSGEPVKILKVELNDEEALATVHFRLSNANSSDLIRQFAILEIKRLSKMIYESPKFRHIDRLGMVGFWKFGAGRDATESKLISAELPRDVAKRVPWRTITVNDFEQVLADDAALWKHAQFQ